MGRIREVIIVGAGPAGAATAAALHRQGVHDLLVLDRDVFPRDKPCGGGLTGHIDGALAALGLRLTVPHVSSHQARVRFGAFERTVALARPVKIVRRADLDLSLLDQVRALGVEVVTGDGVRALDVGPGAVTVRCASGAEHAARIVVGADGVASVVRRHLAGKGGAAPHRLFLQEFAASPRDDAMVYDFTPMTAGLRGYLWVFPVGEGRVNAGVMHYPSTRCPAPDLMRLWRAGLARHGIQLPERGARGWILRGYDPRVPLSAPRLLTVGDAAGVDGLTGEGITVAMEQAVIAAETVAHALASGDFRLAGYRRALRRSRVGRELGLDRRLAARLYQKGPGWQRWLSLALFDDEALGLYAARVAGRAVLADQRLSLLRLLVRHWARTRARRHRLLVAMAGGV